MANTKISELNVLTADNAVDTDLIVLVKDPGGSPETVKMTVGEARALFGGGGNSAELSAAEVLDGSTTPIPVIVKSAGFIQSEADVTVRQGFDGFLIENATDVPKPNVLNSEVGGTSITSFTAPAGTDRVIVLFVTNPSYTTPTSVTWNSMSFTEIADQAGTIAQPTAIWILAIGDSESDQTFDITQSGTATSTYMSIHAMCIDKINQSTPNVQVGIETGDTVSSDTLTLSSTPDASTIATMLHARCDAGENVSITSPGYVQETTRSQAVGGDTFQSRAGVVQNFANKTVTATSTGGNVDMTISGVALNPVDDPSPTLYEVQISGVLGGFSSLTKGQVYYVSNTSSLSTTPGTVSIRVGKAVSATEILVSKA